MSRAIHLFWNDQMFWEDCDTKEVKHPTRWLAQVRRGNYAITFHPTESAAKAAIALDQQQPEPK